MTTATTNTQCYQGTDLAFQTWINEIFTNLAAVGLTQTADTGQLTSSNINASVVVNAQQTTTTMTVNSVTSGGNNICRGMTVTGGTFAANTIVTAQLTGTTGGAGTYTVSTSASVAATAATITLNKPGLTDQILGDSFWRFNDTLQATSPVFFRLRFGSGNSIANPNLWVTLGTGSTGSGALSGTVLAESPASGRTVAGNNTTNYPGYYCYNATQGLAYLANKIGQLNAQASTMGFAIFRSVDSTGAPTADCVHLLCNNNPGGGTGATSSGGAGAILNYNTSAQQATNNSAQWGNIPYSTIYSQEGTSAMVFPVFQYRGSATTAGWGITNALALGLLTEIPMFSTITCTILGSNNMTYIQLGGGLHSGTTVTTYTGSTVGCLAVFQ